MNEYETYTEAKARLEEIAKGLEQNEITLEESLALYEEGAKLVKICYEKLGSAKLRFTQITEEQQGESDE